MCNHEAAPGRGAAGVSVKKVMDEGSCCPQEGS